MDIIKFNTTLKASGKDYSRIVSVSYTHLYYGSSDMKVLNFGLKKEFIDRYDVSEVLKDNHLNPEQIAEMCIRDSTGDLRKDIANLTFAADSVEMNEEVRFHNHYKVMQKLQTDTLLIPVSYTHLITVMTLLSTG